MTNPLQQTTNVDLDAVGSETTVQQSQAPAGSTSSGLPTVGTNAVSEWKTWDPNQWWTDWALPPDPRPSWERWFDWVNQLKALTPALGSASEDWQTMIGQFDDSLRSVRAMRADLAGWTGPSAKTMSDSLDRLENSITTKSAAIQNNPAKLQDLAQTINDAVGPMTALDAEYEQVLQDLNACRQVAERGKPIMLNLATKLLQTGTDLENSVQTDNLAPQPVAPQPLALTSGPQGPTNQLAQVAGSSGLSDPGLVTSASATPVADQPAVAGSGNMADPGQIQTAQQAGVTHTPGVAVGQGDQSTSGLAGTPVTASPTASPTLTGGGAGLAAPSVPQAPVPVAPTVGSSASVMPVPQFVAPSVTPAAVVAGPMAPGVASGVASGVHRDQPATSPAVRPSGERRGSEPAAVVGVPVVPAVVAGTGASGSAAVPDGLRGRTGETKPAAVPAEPVRRVRRTSGPDEAQPLDADAFSVRDAGTGTVTPSR